MATAGKLGGEAAREVQVEVTDGWYSVRATLDPPLAELLQRGKLRIGTGPLPRLS